MANATKNKTATAAAAAVADEAATVAAVVVANGKPVDLNVANTDLPTLVEDVVTATANVYGCNIRVAAKMNELMPFAWFDVEYQEVSDNAKALKPHKAVVLDGFKRAGHSNPSKAYADIRAYGRNLRAGLAPNGKTLADGSPLPTGAGDDATGEGANPVKRSDALFAIEAGTAYFQRLAKSDDAKYVDFANAFAALAKQHIGFDMRTAK